MVQAPIAQPSVATFGSAQTLPQLPQFEGELPRLTSQPLLPSPSQLPKPAPQTGWQVEPLHVLVVVPTLAGLVVAVAQTVPHVPQFAASVARLSQALPHSVPEVHRSPQTPLVQVEAPAPEPLVGTAQT